MTGHHQLAEAMRRHGSTPAQSNSMPRHATISSYDPAAHAVKVMLQPENTESNWMPLGAIGVGNGWGIVCGPQIGDQVHVSFAEGDFHSGVIVGRVFSTAATAPGAPSGETWLVHQTQSHLKLLNNGDVDLVTNRDLIATVGRNLTANVTGNASATIGGTANLAVTGNITSSAPLWTHTGDVSIVGNLSVKLQIVGTGGFVISNTFGPSGPAASFSGDIHGTNGTFTGTSWDFVADGYSIKAHKHTGVTTGGGTSGSATP